MFLLVKFCAAKGPDDLNVILLWYYNKNILYYSFDSKNIFRSFDFLSLFVISHFYVAHLYYFAPKLSSLDINKLLVIQVVNHIFSWNGLEQRNHNLYVIQLYLYQMEVTEFYLFAVDSDWLLIIGIFQHTNWFIVTKQVLAQEF